MSEEHAKPKRALDVRMRKIGGRVHVARGTEVYELDEVGSLIWQLSDGTQSIAELAGAIADQFDVDRDQAEADARRFVDELVEANLIMLAA